MMMKKLFLAWILFVLLHVNTSEAGVVGMTWSGTVNVGSRYRNMGTNSALYRVIGYDTTTNPYTPVILAEVGASIQDGSTVSISSFGENFLEYPFLISSSIAGTLTIGVSDDCPAGTPMTMNISGSTGMTDGIDMSLGRSTDADVFDFHSIVYGSFGVFQAQVFAGETLTFNFWDDILGDWNTTVTLDVVPEPATMGLLALGGIMLRRRSRGL
jgi:hypothetical protein